VQRVVNIPQEGLISPQEYNKLVTWFDILSTGIDIFSIGIEILNKEI